MKYNFKFFKKNILLNIIKFGKIKSNYYRLKKIYKFIYDFLYKKFKKKIKVYLIKLYYKKGDFTLVGELGILKKNENFFLK